MVLKAKQKALLTTSLVVPFELLSGMPECESPLATKEFHRRQVALRKYEQLVGIKGTYWCERSAIIARAFGVHPPAKTLSSFQILLYHLDDGAPYYYAVGDPRYGPRLRGVRYAKTHTDRLLR